MFYRLLEINQGTENRKKELRLKQYNFFCLYPDSEAVRGKTHWDLKEGSEAM